MMLFSLGTSWKSLHMCMQIQLPHQFTGHTDDSFNNAYVMDSQPAASYLL